MTKLIFLGDFFYDYSVKKDDIEKIAQWIKSQDAGVILNLEGPLGNCGEKRKKRGPNLSQSDVSIEILKEMSVIGVSLSNNHIMDYGSGALERTIKLLRENDIKYTGAGMTEEEAHRPMVFTLQNQEYYFYSYGWEIEETLIARKDMAGGAAYDRKAIYNQIRNDVKKDRKVVLLMHWGFENNLLPQPVDVQFARNAIDMGVELVIGHHPHVIQPFEKYHEHYIFYSLGNFYFSSMRERFSKKFDTRTPDENNYGLGVFWDFKTNECEEFLIRYDMAKVCSEVCDKTGHEILNVQDRDVLVKEYKRELIYNKRNINPVLRKDNWYSMVKLEFFRIAIRKYARNIYRLLKRK